jgi:hypothetical protein
MHTQKHTRTYLLIHTHTYIHPSTQTNTNTYTYKHIHIPLSLSPPLFSLPPPTGCRLAYSYCFLRFASKRSKILIHTPRTHHAHKHTHTHTQLPTSRGDEEAQAVQKQLTHLKKNTVRPVLLHSFYTIVTLILHCCCTVVTLLLKCCCNVTLTVRPLFRLRPLPCVCAGIAGPHAIPALQSEFGVNFKDLKFTKLLGKG